MQDWLSTKNLQKSQWLYQTYNSAVKIRTMFCMFCTDMQSKAQDTITQQCSINSILLRFSFFFIKGNLESMERPRAGPQTSWRSTRRAVPYQHLKTCPDQNAVRKFMINDFPPSRQDMKMIETQTVRESDDDRRQPQVMFETTKQLQKHYHSQCFTRPYSSS